MHDFATLQLCQRMQAQAIKMVGFDMLHDHSNGGPSQILHALSNAQSCQVAAATISSGPVPSPTARESQKSTLWFVGMMHGLRFTAWL